MRMFLLFIAIISSTSSFSHSTIGIPTTNGHRSADQRSGPYKYAAFDLDGTLLNSGHKLSKNTKEYLRQLVADGFRIMFATGRSIGTVHEHILDLNLEIPVICSNGAEGKLCKPIADATTGSCVQSQTLFSIPVPQPVVDTVLSEANKLGLVVQYYVGDDIFANPADEAAWQMPLCLKYCVLTGSKTMYVSDFAETMKQGLPSKLLVLCPVEQQDEMIAHFERIFGDGEDPPHLVRGSLGWFMEILPPKVNKGNGLERMCSHLNMSIEHVVAFGDGDNDLEFIQQAGWGIVMKNGRSVVKKVANEVIDLSNNEDGVVNTLEAMRAQKQLSFDN